jgi:hypothetical protein
MKRHVTLSCTAALIISLPFLAHSVSITSGTGMWPEWWPNELEPYREQAKTTGHRNMSSYFVYELRFTDRADFENAWPHVISVKSQGAPLTLRSVGADYVDQASAPCVRITCPPWSSGWNEFEGLVLGPPWADELKLESGLLPEFVVKHDGKWVPATPGMLHPRIRVRVDLELVVDGKIVDLNRIQLPVDTPIIDKRFEEAQS